MSADKRILQSVIYIFKKGLPLITALQDFGQ